MRRFLLQCVVFVVLVAAGLSAYATDEPKDKIQVAILTGQNNHAWMMDSPVLQNILNEAGLFEATILQTPDAKDPDKAEKWAAFNPKFDDYDVVVLNYNGEMWPEPVKQAWVAYIAGGGKGYAFHAANNTHRGWAEYEQMIGLLWRNSGQGKRIYFDDEGNKVVQEPGQGPGAGHGAQHAYVVDTIDNEHPVFKGLPDQWLHAKDELYHGQRGPAENMTILLKAYDDAKHRGTGVSEPVLWTIPYGEGLMMTNVMGHWWKNQQEGTALACAGFQTIFTRSIEWLATGEVTTAKPDDFPTADQVSLRELSPYEPLAYIHVHGVPGSDPLASCDCSPQTEPGFVPAWVQFADMFEPLPDDAAAAH